MVEFYKTIDGRVTEIGGFTEGCWVNMVHPSSDELEAISRAAHVEEEFVRAALDPEESSRVERDFTRIEKRLYDSLQNEELIQLLGLSKSLVYFSASLKGNEVTMEKVLRGRVLKLYEDDRDILEDALIEIRQAIEMAGIYSSILSGTMDAYASVVSNNLNIIMKVLTVLTIIMTIPNIIFGFYGMNIGGEAIPGDFFWWIPLLISAAACFFAWFMLKKKNLY